MAHSVAADNPRRPYLLGGALAVAVLVLVGQFVAAPQALTALPLYDFVEYWAAGRLTLQGDNPYAVGRGDDGILMWNPPWTLPLVLPFGALDVRLAHLLWLALQFTALVFCSDRLWRLYGGAADYRWVGWLIALTFLPSYFALTAGQISPLILLGATLFLHFSERRSDLLMGVAAVLMAIKPHLCYLFWIALLCWAVRERRWKVLAGGVATGILLIAIPLAFDHGLLQHYWLAFTNQPPSQYRSPTLAHCVRVLIDPDNFRLQFLALLPGLAWFVPWFYWHRNRWEWQEQMPWLLLVSVLTTAYGGWPFDLVLLLVPVMQIAARVQGRESARLRYAAIAAHVVIGLIAVAQIALGVEYFWFIWICPTILAGYVGFRLWLRPPQDGTTLGGVELMQTASTAGFIVPSSWASGSGSNIP
jgi:Glycosyltransferase family 87